MTRSRFLALYLTLVFFFSFFFSHMCVYKNLSDQTKSRWLHTGCRRRLWPRSATTASRRRRLIHKLVPRRRRRVPVYKTKAEKRFIFEAKISWRWSTRTGFKEANGKVGKKKKKLNEREFLFIFQENSILIQHSLLWCRFSPSIGKTVKIPSAEKLSRPPCAIFTLLIHRERTKIGFVY